MKKLAIGLALVVAAGAVLAMVRRRRADTEDFSWSPSYSGDGDAADDAVEALPDPTPNETG